MRRHFSGTGCGACGRGLVTSAPGRRRDPALLALRPVCREPAGRRGLELVRVRKRGPASDRAKASVANAAMERREARVPDRKGAPRLQKA